MRKKTLFVIDDEKGIRVLLKEVFERSGFNLITYENATDAIDALQEKKPDIILVDYWIEGMRGDQFAQQISNDGYIIPVILMSGMSKAELANKINQGTVSAIIEKPFNITEMVEVVNSLLTEHANNS